MKAFLRNNKWSLLMILGVIAGILTGYYYPNATVFAPLGDIYLNATFCAIVPMVFFSISSTIAGMDNSRKTTKIFFTVISIFILTAIIAFLFMYVCIQISPPQVDAMKNIDPLENTRTLDIPSLLVSFFTQPDFTLLFSKTTILPLIFASVILGFAVAKAGGAESPVGKLLINMNTVIRNIIGIINLFAPIGLFAFFANLVAKNGNIFAGTIASVVGRVYVVSALYLVLFAPLYAYIGGGMQGVKVMLRHIAGPLIVSAGTSSSIATIPENMKQAKLSGIPDDIASMVIPLGATMHMDGIAIIEAIRMIALFSLFRMEMTSVDFVLAIILGVLLSVATPGIPGPQINSLVLCSVFFFDNYEIAYAILVAIGAACGPIATAVNASLDYVISFVVSRIFYGKNWLKNAQQAESEKAV